MRTDVVRAVVRAPAVDVERLRPAADDLRAAGRIAELVLEPTEGGELTVDVTL
jgi:valyl-tRNA synthetase